MYSDALLCIKLQEVFKFDKPTAEGIIAMAKEYGEYIDLCECVELKQSLKRVTYDVQHVSV